MGIAMMLHSVREISGYTAYPLQSSIINKGIPWKWPKYVD